MAFTSGTVVGHKNLLKTVVDFVSGNTAMGNRKWTIKQNKNNKNEEYILEAPGLAGTDKMYFGIKLFQDEKADYFNWRVSVAMGYEAGLDMNEQPEVLSYGYLLWDKSIKYWLTANGQRLILVCKVSTIYTVLYMGKILPYAAPGQYPYPVILCGAHTSWTTRWSDRSVSHAHLQAPAHTGTIRLPGNIWKPLSSFQKQDVWSANIQDYVFMTPAAYFGLSGKRESIYKRIKKNPDNSFAVLPYILATRGDKTTGRDRNILGELDGMLWVSGDSNASENNIAVNGKTYIVIQNVWRTAWHDYCAVIQD